MRVAYLWHDRFCPTLGQRWAGAVVEDTRVLRMLSLPRPTRQEALAELARGGPQTVGHGDPPGGLRDSVRRCFDGQPFETTLTIQPAFGTPFQRRVWETARRIPRGEVVTYRDLAVLVGSPGAARAVGQAMGANPIPLYYPCHRVVAAGGGLGGFGGGTELKRCLLRLEGIIG